MTLHPSGTKALFYYTSQGIKKAFEKKTTLSLVKDVTLLTALGNKKISTSLSQVVNTLPDQVLNTPPISSMFKPIASQFGTVNSNLEAVLEKFKPNEVADLAKEGLGLHEDPSMILDRHLRTVRHPNIHHMALKLSSFVPLELLRTGIKTPAYEKGVEMMSKVCDEASRLGKKIYIDAEGVPEQRLIEEAQLTLTQKYGDTVYSTFQAVRSDIRSKVDNHLEFCIKTGTPPLLKIVKGAYFQKEHPDFPSFYHTSFEQTDLTFRHTLALAGQYPGKKHLFIGTMNPSLIQFSQKILNPSDYAIANLKGMDVGDAMGISTLIYHPIALQPSELAKYGVRRLIELGDASNLTERRVFLLQHELRERLGLSSTAPLSNTPPSYMLTPKDQNLMTQATSEMATFIEKNIEQSYIHSSLMSPEIIKLVTELCRKTPSRPMIHGLLTVIRTDAEAHPHRAHLWATPEVCNFIIQSGKLINSSSYPLEPLFLNIEKTVETLLRCCPEGEPEFNTPPFKVLISEFKKTRERVLEHPGF